MHHRRAFTLVELLVVVTIILLLLAILLPSIQRSVNLAIRTKCMAQTKQILTGTFNYAADNFGLLPARPGWGAHNHRPHTMVSSGLDVDLVKSFINPYLGGKRDDLMFCPSSLITARNPTTTSPDYTYDNVTYQFHAYDTDEAWIIDMPNLTKMSELRAGYGLWSCLTLAHLGGEFYFGHDRPIVPGEPDGMNSALSDGSARWVDWPDVEHYITYGTQYYMWPKPQARNHTETE